MKMLIVLVIVSGLFTQKFASARLSCGDENLKQWLVCEKNSDCAIEVVPCAQVRSINKKFLKDSKSAQECLSAIAGPCAPGTLEPKAEKFRATCSARSCLAQAIK